MLHEKSLIIAYIAVISWDIKLLKELILYWNKDESFFIHRDHHSCFYEYNYILSI